MSPGKGLQILIPQGDAHRAPLQSLLPHTAGHTLCQHGKDHLYIRIIHQIPGRGGGIAHTLDRRLGVHMLHRRSVLPPGKGTEHQPVLAQQTLQKIRPSRRQLADGINAVSVQLAGGGRADAQKITARQGPHHPVVVFPADNRHRVRLFIIRTQFGKDLVKADPHADGNAQFRLYPTANFLGDLFSGAVIAGHIQPVLVQPERLNIVAVILIDPPCHLGKAHIQREVRRYHHQLRALLPRLPQRLPRHQAVAGGNLVFRQDNSVAALCAAAHRHRLVSQLRAVQALHRGIKLVAIHMQNGALHSLRPLSCYRTFVLRHSIHRF